MTLGEMPLIVRFHVKRRRKGYYSTDFVCDFFIHPLASGLYSAISYISHSGYVKETRL